MNLINTDFKLGILGGGQLGKMLCIAAQPWHLPIWILDKDKNFPAGKVCHNFIEGDFKNYDDVLNFGRQVDVLTIEIEHVNTEALHQLVKEGIQVHPAPTQLDIIKDKGAQKEFYAKHQIPTAPFQLLDDQAAILAAIDKGELAYPFVQKSRKAGYDGKGVAIIRSEDDLPKIMDVPSMVEEMADIDKELAVQVALSTNGEMKAFPVVEMEFHPTANLVEFLLCPARISAEVKKQITALALDVAKAFNLCGLLSIEFFLNKSGEIWVNEVAPRPHNSGHHTIEGLLTSQFQQHLRAVLGLPLGDTSILEPAVMINLLGEDGHTGQAVYHGIPESLQLKGTYLHIYGKSITKPFRKMGHATVLDTDINQAIERARKVREYLKITT